MNPFPVKRAGELETQGAQVRWLIQDLWTDQAVGILGGEPKCCKSFLALDMALSVASGKACLGRFPVEKPGPVLLFPAEDSGCVVRSRLENMCAAASLSLQPLPIQVITAPTVRLDVESDRQRLTQTVRSHQPILMILDPLIRLHRVDENDACQIASLLSYLRDLQRRFHLAVVVVHHARKNSASARPGQALRGSSELHGWGDSNLYMRRQADRLTLSTEHRAAASQDHIPVELTPHGLVCHLKPTDGSGSAPSAAAAPPSPRALVQQTLQGLTEPVGVRELRELCRMRTATLCSALTELAGLGLVTHDSRGYRLNLPLDPVSLSHPSIESLGNGNGKPRT